MLTDPNGVVAGVYRPFMEALGAIVAVVDGNGKVHDANANGLALGRWRIGADPMPCLWSGIEDVDESAALLRAVQRALAPDADGEPQRSGCNWLLPDGTETALGWTFTALAGTPYALAVAIAAPELADRLRAERTLRERANRLTMALKAMHGGSWDWEPTTDTHLWSPELYAIFGVDPAGPTPTLESWLETLHPADRDTTVAAVRQAIADGTPLSHEYRHIRPDGEVRWMHVVGHSECDGAGQPTRMSGITFDITERRLAELALDREQRFSNAVLDSVPGLLYLYDAQGRLVRWNQQHETMTGYDATELAQMTLLDWYRDQPEDIARITAGVQRALETGFGEEEGNLRCKDGHTRLCRFTAVRVEIDGDTYFAGIGIDISEQRRAEQALRENESRQAAMIANISDVIAIIDADGINRYKSPNIERWFGWKPEEVVGKNTWRNVHPDDLEANQAIFAGVVAKPGVPGRGECRYLCRDGSYKWIAYTAVSMLDDPHVRGVLLNYHDVTERHRMEEELAAEKERLAVTLHSIGDGVVATDTDGRVVLMNKVAEQLTGWRAGRAVGRPLRSVLQLLDADTRQPLPDAAQRVLAEGGVVEPTGRTLLISRDGSEHLIADSGAPINDRDSRVVGAVLVLRDVTDEEQREAALRRSQKLESLAILAGGVAHDFNNLLTGILGNVSLARMDAEAGTPLAMSLAEAESAAVRAKGLTQQLLTFASGGAPVRRLAHIADIAQSTTVFSCRGTSVDCRFDFASDLWLAEIDEDQIGQVIQNLAINATQAMPEGGTLTVGAANATIAHGNPWSLRPGAYLRVWVADQGTGMPPDVAEHAFDPYYTTKAQGSGLGLAVCHSVISRHAGHITLTTTPGQGTTFEILLPANPEASTARATTPAEARPGSGRILVLDDEPAIRSLAVRLLGHLGYDAQAVADGLEAITAYAAARETGQPYDAVIMDLTIPGGVGGRETLGLLSEIDPDVRAVVSSGYATDPVMANYTDFGFRAVLTKPYRLDDVASVLAEVLSEA